MQPSDKLKYSLEEARAERSAELDAEQGAAEARATEATARELERKTAVEGQMQRAQTLLEAYGKNSSKIPQEDGGWKMTRTTPWVTVQSVGSDSDLQVRLADETQLHKMVSKKDETMFRTSGRLLNGDTAMPWIDVRLVDHTDPEVVSEIEELAIMFTPRTAQRKQPGKPAIYSRHDGYQAQEIQPGTPEWDELDGILSLMSRELPRTNTALAS
jgi:hypothetical protein